MKTLLKNGTLIDYKTNIFEKYDILIKKYRSYSNLCTDPALKSLCCQTADKHQAHFDTLMSSSWIFDSFSTSQSQGAHISYFSCTKAIRHPSSSGQRPDH